ncbi:MAG: TIGR03084 family protein [Chloroflexi bacterium]|nr:TIGR03084 family protein [Chloroflexota bacterium]
MSDDQMQQLVADLVAEQDTLDRLTAAISLDAWDAPSPAEGWTLRDCVAHLAEFDETAGLILAHGKLPEAARGERQGVLSAGQIRAKGLSVAALLEWWRESRERLAAHAAAADPRARLPWFGPPMSARSFVTARLMEAWSHGLDIHDAAGSLPVDSDRLRHVAHLGYATREFAYRNRGLEPPRSSLYVELVAPSGAVWTWGPGDAANRISGPAGDFCRVVTQRLHPADTALRSEGEDAAEFLRLAQAFAGPPGPGRPPKSSAP